jgi:hypothetical protein
VRLTDHTNGTATISGTLRKGCRRGVPADPDCQEQVRDRDPGVHPDHHPDPGHQDHGGRCAGRTVRATGYPAPAVTESGQLPSGLTFTDHGHGTATIAGTPAAGSDGRFRVAINATNTQPPGNSRSSSHNGAGEDEHQLLSRQSKAASVSWSG